MGQFDSLEENNEFHPFNLGAEQLAQEQEPKENPAVDRDINLS